MTRRPVTHDGVELHTGYYVKWNDKEGHEHIGRVRAYDAWGKIQVVDQGRKGLWGIVGREFQASEVDFSHEGF